MKMCNNRCDKIWFFRCIQLNNILKMSDSRINHWPAIFPLYFSNKGLSSDYRLSLIWSCSKHNYIPVTFNTLHKISMSYTSNRILFSHMSMRQNRIIEIVFIRSCNISASCNTNAVIWSCSSLCVNHIIPTVFLQQMWTLRPNYITHGTFPYIITFPYKLHRLKI